MKGFSIDNFRLYGVAWSNLQAKRLICSLVLSPASVYGRLFCARPIKKLMFVPVAIAMTSTAIHQDHPILVSNALWPEKAIFFGLGQMASRDLPFGQIDIQKHGQTKCTINTAMNISYFSFADRLQYSLAMSQWTLLSSGTLTTNQKFGTIHHMFLCALYGMWIASLITARVLLLRDNAIYVCTWRPG